MVSANAVALHVVNNWPVELWPKAPFEYHEAWLLEFKTFMESEVVNVKPPPSAFSNKDATSFAAEIFLACKSIAKMTFKMASLKKSFYENYNQLCTETGTAANEAQCVAHFMDFDSWATKNNCDHFHSLDSWLHVRIKALFATDDWRGLFDSESESEDGSEDDEKDELMESDSDEEESELEEESDASEDQESDGEDATAPTENAAERKQA